MEAAKDDDKPVVMLSRGELKALMREAAAEALAQAAAPPMQWIDVEAAAAHFGVSGQTIRNWIAQGAPAAKPGRDYKVQLAPFTAWVEAHRPGVKLKRVK
jgi:transposase